MNDFTVSVQGADVPKIGLGTWLLTGRECERGVAEALAAGYRHVDTARAYENEREVGAGIRASGVARELRTDYLDLYLMHWPNPDVPVAETLTALSEVREEGKVRHIGVSNFTTALVEEALRHARLFANQVEYHPYLDQRVLLGQAQRHDLLLEAYSPFAHGRLHDDPALTEIGAAHGKSAGQVALRWLIDQPNVCALPKATAPERIRENLDVFDFALSDEERRRIAALARGERTADPPWAPAWD